MAARVMRLRHQNEVREKIRVSSLINVLQDHALGKKGKEEIAPTRIKAIEILLKKRLPDLSATEHTGPDGANLIPTVINVIGPKS